jgi:hypothetical protein
MFYLGVLLEPISLLESAPSSKALVAGNFSLMIFCFAEAVLHPLPPLRLVTYDSAVAARAGAGAGDELYPERPILAVVEMEESH